MKSKNYTKLVLLYIIIILLIPNIFNFSISFSSSNKDGMNRNVHTSGYLNYYNQEPQICYDGEGGAIVVWKYIKFVSDDLTDNIVYAQRVNSSGAEQWSTDDIEICSGKKKGLSLHTPAICSDGNGGVIVIITETLGDSSYGSVHSSKLYCQKVDAEGNLLWGSDGKLIYTQDDEWIYEGEVNLCGDGMGGAIITWEVNSQVAGRDSNISAQRVDSNGNLLWSIDSIDICKAIDAQSRPVICSDGMGGAIIAWCDWRNLDISRSDIYAQRIDSSGNYVWVSNGNAICTAPNDQFYPRLCSDGAGGAVITWQDRRNYSISGDDIYARRIDSNGNLMWEADGIPICTAEGTQEDLEISDNAIDEILVNSTIIIWTDRRDESKKEVYAQYLNLTGDIQWNFDGIPIFEQGEYDNRDIQEMCSDNRGGIIITWDNTVDVTTIYAQNINPKGSKVWDDLVIGHDYAPRLSIDGEGGAFITWVEYKELYMQHINSSGDLILDGLGTRIRTFVEGMDYDGDGDSDEDDREIARKRSVCPSTDIETILIVIPLLGIIPVILTIIHKKFKAFKV